MTQKTFFKKKKKFAFAPLPQMASEFYSKSRLGSLSREDTYFLFWGWVVVVINDESYQLLNYQF